MVQHHDDRIKILVVFVDRKFFWLFCACGGWWLEEGFGCIVTLLSSDAFGSREGFLVPWFGFVDVRAIVSVYIGTTKTKDTLPVELRAYGQPY
jgi:hypothetical protein